VPALTLDPEMVEPGTAFAEQVEDMTQRTMHPLEYLVIVKRRKWWVIAPFLLCVVGGLALALLLPATFRSSATIGVQAAAVTPDLVARGTQLTREERLRALEQQLRSPEVLQRVVRDEGLAADRPVEEVAQSLRARISVEVPRPIARTEGTPDLNAFDIVYRDHTAEQTQRVTNRLAQVFVDEHSRSREVQAEGTSDFIATQLRASHDRIAELEAQVRAAKERHTGSLPEQSLANLQTLGGLRAQLESTSNNLRSDQDRLSMIDRQMQSMRQGLFAAPAGQASSSPRQRVAALQRDLAAARSRYTDKHPEVLTLEEELRAARAEAEALRDQPESSRDELLAADPMYQQLVAEREMTQLRIQGFRRTEAQLRGEIARYQQRVEAAPMVEQALKATSREYDLEQERYKQLSQQYAAAQVQETVARTRGGERFSVLNAAYLPDGPESPNKARILLIALALGIALGGGAALGREYLDWSIRDAQGLEDLDLPVLAEIPRIRGAA
jgi:polysaccharide biosynthesis transport protein